MVVIPFCVGFRPESPHAKPMLSCRALQGPQIKAFDGEPWRGGGHDYSLPIPLNRKGHSMSDLSTLSHVGL